MTKMMMIPACLGFLLSGLGTARADVVVSASLEVLPPVPAPSFLPPRPVVEPPLAPMQTRYVAPVAVASPEVAGGQWVYTAEYGWIYMPYGDHYVFAQAASAYAYVYYPAFGWRWLAAPWVIGSGRYPHFGDHGPFAFAWYRNLHRSGNPWCAHYAPLHSRPWSAPRAVVQPRPAFGVRAAAAPAPARIPAPSRAGIAPAPVSPPRHAMVAQRDVGGPAHGPSSPRAASPAGRGFARR
jgi:hypothetical protein